MKKLFLLLAGGIVSFGANAQYAKHIMDAGQPHKTVVQTQSAHTGMPSHHAARNTSVTFYTETFGSGTSTVLPTGWTSGILSGTGTWHWTAVASGSTYTMGAMMSTTANDGWMIFDSDSIGAACGAACSPSGYLQSPAINCSAHSTVRLTFEDYYRSYNDSCSIWVSTSSTFSSYQVFPVTLNDNTAGNAYTANPATVQINITSVAGSQAAVYIRYVYYGYAGGSYSWMVDDMSLSDVDPIDIALSKSCVVYNSGSGTGTSSFGAKPAKMIDTLYPISFAANNGYTDEPTVNVNAQIYRGSTSVYTNNLSLNLPAGAVDSVANFSQFAGYYSNTQGAYLVPFATNVASDAVTSNNLDTAAFVVSDTTWSQNPVRNGAVDVISRNIVYSPASGGSAARANSPGTGFNMTAGAVDTLTSVSVSFSSTTVAGQIVGVQIYHFDAPSTSWVYDGLTTFRALTAADISTASSIVYANFPVDVVGTGGQIILDGSTTGVTYAAVVKGSNNTAIVDVEESDNPADINFIGSVGVSDTSFNNGGLTQDFGNGHLPFAEPYTPLINLNFGTATVGVRNVTLTNAIGIPYPNPANTSVNIPFITGGDAVVTITLSNVIGQNVKSQQINAVGGKQMKAVFATNDLADGVYMITMEANGARNTSRIVVAH